MTDLLYQPYAAYSAYFPYQRHFTDQKVGGFSKLPDPYSQTHTPHTNNPSFPPSFKHDFFTLKTENYPLKTENYSGISGNLGLKSENYGTNLALKPENYSLNNLNSLAQKNQLNNYSLNSLNQKNTNSYYSINPRNNRFSNFGTPKPENFSTKCASFLPATKLDESQILAAKLEIGEQQPITTRYVSGSCVLLTYFSGDVSSNVDAHFSRALTQAKSSLIERNFPASFWDSNYTPPSFPHDLALSTESFMSSIHSLSSLHQPDPWHYPLGGHGGHRGEYGHVAHRNDYPYTGTSRYPHPYPPLFVQPSLTSRLGGDVTRAANDVWNSRYHGETQRLNGDFPTRAHLNSSLAGRRPETQCSGYPSFVTT